jgi:2-hydroxychromene-2-carboxylate isomerase
MTLTYDVFWSFRSPYSYLLTPRLLKFEREYDVIAKVRPVYPIAVRVEGFFKTVNPLWWRYLRQDVARTAEMLGMPYAPPDPDPILMDIGTGEVSKHQPYIVRLTRLGVAAAKRGKGLPFLKEVSTVIFGGTRGWHLSNHLASAAERAGLEIAELEFEIEANGERYEAVIAENQKGQEQAGHWGVPLMAFEGEPFFGQDRFEALKWRMAQKGLTIRA